VVKYRGLAAVIIIIQKGLAKNNER